LGIPAAVYALPTRIRPTRVSCGPQFRRWLPISVSTLAQLLQVLGPEVISAPDPDADRYRRDFSVTAPAGVRILALARPRNSAEVAAVLRFCNERGVAVVPQGGMTGLVGGAVPISACVIISLERMRAILEIDRVAGTLTVEAGAPLQAVQEAADAADLMFPLDLGSRGSCQIGGNAATNAGGNRVLRYGMMRDLVLGIEVVLADGSVLSSLHKMLKNNSGYDLRQLFIGSEGTLGVITTLVLKLFPKPRSQSTALCMLRDYAAVLQLLGAARAGLAANLSAFEVMWPAFYDLGTTGLGRKPPLAASGGLCVLLEAQGVDAAQDSLRFEQLIAASMESAIVSDAVIAQSQREVREFWDIRDCPGEFPAVFWPQISFDVSVPTGDIGALVQELRDVLLERWPAIQLLFFGHAADGNLHLSARTAPDVLPEQEIEQLVYEVVGRRKGAISAEHGIGLQKRPYLYHSRSAAEIATMRRLKAALDPRGVLNPGKIF
jgi:FAD/FMN-containing dehydrogenase